MTKTYTVDWRTEDKEGEITVTSDNFGELGIAILEALWPPPGCPVVITKIELLEPEKYFNG